MIGYVDTTSGGRFTHPEQDSTWTYTLGDDVLMDCEAGVLRGPVTDFVEKWYGKRCPDYEPNCARCRAWKAIQAIFGEDIA